MKVKVWKVLLAILIVSGASITTISVVAAHNFDNGVQSRIDAVHAVYTACTNERRNVNVTTVEACKNSQESTNTEYVCSSDISHCWVEVK